MRFKFLLVSTAVLALGIPVGIPVGGAAVAMDVQTLEAATALLYPGAKLIPADFTLTGDLMERIKSEYDVPLMRPGVKAWRVDGGGWLFLDQVYGLSDIVTYMVAVDDSGAVSGVEILVCAEGFCDTSTPRWRAQLLGKTRGKWQPKEAVQIISGTTLSSVHVTEGVKKLLAIHALFLPKTP